jgi:hypothetical protein
MILAAQDSILTGSFGRGPTLGIYIDAARSRSPNLAKNAEFLSASG